MHAFVDASFTSPERPSLPPPQNARVLEALAAELATLRELAAPAQGEPVPAGERAALEAAYQQAMSYVPG